MKNNWGVHGISTGSGSPIAVSTVGITHRHQRRTLCTRIARIDALGDGGRKKVRSWRKMATTATMQLRRRRRLCRRRGRAILSRSAFFPLSKAPLTELAESWRKLEAGGCLFLSFMQCGRRERERERERERDRERESLPRRETRRKSGNRPSVLRFFFSFFEKKQLKQLQAFRSLPLPLPAAERRRLSLSSPGWTS